MANGRFLWHHRFGATRAILATFIVGLCLFTPAVSKADPVGTSDWQVVSSPNPGPRWNELRHIYARSASDVWAVGAFHRYPERYGALVAHFDGKAWQQAVTPRSGSGCEDFLYGVNGTASDDVWAVGYSEESLNGRYSTLILHY